MGKDSFHVYSETIKKRGKRTDLPFPLYKTKRAEKKEIT